MTDKELQELFEHQPSEAFQEKIGQRSETIDQYQKPLWRYSRWWIADLLVLLVLGNLGLFSMFYVFLEPLLPIAFWVGLLCIVFRKRIYDRTYPQTTPWRRLVCIIRAIVYTLLPLSLLLVDMQSWKEKWCYPMQRAVFLSHYSNPAYFDYLPASIPDQATHYERMLDPGHLQAEASVLVTFRTDSDHLQEYIAYAERCGVQGKPVDGWELHFCETYHVPEEGTMLYVFDHVGNSERIYLINESAGFFLAYLK